MLCRTLTARWIALFVTFLPILQGETELTGERVEEPAYKLAKQGYPVGSVMKVD